jgi:hypothetical protein
MSKRHFYGAASIACVITAGWMADQGHYCSTISLIIGGIMCFYAAIVCDADRMESMLDEILDSTP